MVMGLDARHQTCVMQTL